MSDTSSYLNFQQDPTWLAYQRSLDFQAAEQRRVIEDQIARVHTRLAQQIPELQQSGGWERERLSGGMESRGLYRSGEHEEMLNRQRILEARRLNALNVAAANSIAGAEGNLANQDAALGIRRSESTMQAAQSAAAYRAQLEQQRTQTAEERALQLQFRSEDKAYNDQARASDRTYAEQQNQKQLAQQQSLYDKQLAADQSRYDQQKADYNAQQAGMASPTPTIPQYLAPAGAPTGSYSSYQGSGLYRPPGT